MTAHVCVPCEIAAEITAHRDTYAAKWGERKAAFSYAAWIARTHCPDRVAAIELAPEDT